MFGTQIQIPLPILDFGQPVLYPVSVIRSQQMRSECSKVLGQTWRALSQTPTPKHQAGKNSSLTPSFVTSRRSIPFPLVASLAIADFIARNTRSLHSTKERLSLYVASSTPTAISAPVPIAAYLSGNTEPKGSSV